jgi:hypothetical protein
MSHYLVCLYNAFCHPIEGRATNTLGMFPIHGRDVASNFCFMWSQSAPAIAWAESPRFVITTHFVTAIAESCFKVNHIKLAQPCRPRPEPPAHHFGRNERFQKKLICGGWPAQNI